jgi:hypothetical protein
LLLVLFGVVQRESFLVSEVELAVHACELDVLDDLVLVRVLHGKKVEADEEMAQSHCNFFPGDIEAFGPFAHGHALDEPYAVFDHDAAELMYDADF